MYIKWRAMPIVIKKTSPKLLSICSYNIFICQSLIIIVIITDKHADTQAGNGAYSIMNRFCSLNKKILAEWNFILIWDRYFTHIRTHTHMNLVIIPFSVGHRYLEFSIALCYRMNNCSNNSYVRVILSAMRSTSVHRNHTVQWYDMFCIN